jgi:hypothetical protein
MCWYKAFKHISAISTRLGFVQCVQCVIFNAEKKMRFYAKFKNEFYFLRDAEEIGKSVLFSM